MSLTDIRRRLVEIVDAKAAIYHAPGGDAGLSRRQRAQLQELDAEATELRSSAAYANECTAAARLLTPRSGT